MRGPIGARLLPYYVLAIFPLSVHLACAVRAVAILLRCVPTWIELHGARDSGAVIVAP